MPSDWRPVVDKIDDVVAEDTWGNKDGNRRKLIVGRPQIVPVDAAKPLPTRYCQIYIEGVTSGIRPIFGAGAVDALMTEMTAVRSFFHSFQGVYEGAATNVYVCQQ